jgi:hypothetical protein
MQYTYNINLIITRGGEAPGEPAGAAVPPQICNFFILYICVEC